MNISRVDVAIVGVGASGALVATHLKRAGLPGLRVALIEAGARAARGLAYGTPYGAHLLNVPADRMSAVPDDEGHFVRWLQTRIPEASSETFAPRILYGDYLSEVLNGAAPSAAAELFRVAGTAVGLTRQGAHWLVHLHDGRTFAASAVVLALGNLAPTDPLDLAAPPPGYLRDPWAPGAALGLDPHASVLLIGTGLTMVDVALALRANEYRGPLHALSRHGRLPQPHRDYSPRPLRSLPPNLNSPRRALAWVRSEIARAEKEGGDWRAVIDSLRPYTAQVWRSWSLSQRASFLRHARNLWEPHRHRVAPEVAAELDALLADGSLIIHRGRLLALRQSGSDLEVVWKDRETQKTNTLMVRRVINCTGPASDYSRIDLPLIAELRQAGWLTADSLALGIETDEDGCLIGADGKRVSGIYTLGPLRRPALWESTAIPEIRAQAAALAQVIRSSLQGTA